MVTPLNYHIFLLFMLLDFERILLLLLEYIIDLVVLLSADCLIRCNNKKMPKLNILLSLSDLLISSNSSTISRASDILP